jgi:hypothetical protein
MKKLLTNAAKGLIGIVLSVIITAWLTGQPLTGLTKLRGLYKTFIQSSVPAWTFALVFLAALLGIYYSFTHLPRRRPKGEVHFIPDAHNNGWAKQTDTEMDVRISGTFTYDGPDELVVLKAFLKGTQPTTDMIARMDMVNAFGTTETIPELWLSAGHSRRVFIYLRLKPVVGTPGKPMRRQFILRDKFNRDFLIGPIEFPYIGRKEGSNPG